MSYAEEMDTYNDAYFHGKFEGVSSLELLAAAYLRTSRVLSDIETERAAQDAKWGEQNHIDGTGVNIWDTWAMEQAKARCQAAGTAKHPDTWRLILAEEVAEAFDESDVCKLRTELIQVAAVACAWVEAIDRREV